MIHMPSGWPHLKWTIQCFLVKGLWLNQSNFTAYLSPLKETPLKSKFFTSRLDLCLYRFAPAEHFPYEDARGVWAFPTRGRAWCLGISHTRTGVVSGHFPHEDARGVWAFPIRGRAWCLASVTVFFHLTYYCRGSFLLSTYHFLTFLFTVE